MIGRRRVFIIEDAEKLNEHSANSLLKVLEEPPAFTHIILAASNPLALLPTIRSRCRLLPFALVGREEIEKVLLDRAFSPEQARILALLADGNVERARELEWNEVQALKESAWELFEALSSGDRPSRFLERFGHVPKAVHEEFAEVLEVFATFARDMLLLRTGGDPGLLINPGFEARIREAAAAWGPDRLLDLLAEIDLLLVELGRNMNKNLLATAFVSNIGELKHV
jgi:DNA polymerase-3 subunit delta'